MCSTPHGEREHSEINNSSSNTFNNNFSGLCRHCVLFNFEKFILISKLVHFPPGLSSYSFFFHLFIGLYFINNNYKQLLRIDRQTLYLRWKRALKNQRKIPSNQTFLLSIRMEIYCLFPHLICDCVYCLPGWLVHLLIRLIFVFILHCFLILFRFLSR